MKKKTVAIIIFKTKNKILIQDRRPWDKYHVDFGFFGGKIEEGENPEQTLKRELKEELNIDIIDYSFYKHINKIMPELDLEVEYYIFIALIPNLSKIKCNEGKPFLTDIKSTLKLKMISGDKEILEEFFKNEKTKTKK